MPNLYTEFMRLIPTAPLLVGVVDSLFSGGAVVTLHGGGQLRARGTASMGQRVYVRDGVIEGEAPALTPVDIEV